VVSTSLAPVSSGAHVLVTEDTAMGEFSIWHWLIVLAVILLLFGGGKVSGLMGDFAKGIKAFKHNMADDRLPAPTQEDQVSQEAPQTHEPDRVTTG
jgi:sec-independent protein translocase protein TatA